LTIHEYQVSEGYKGCERCRKPFEYLHIGSDDKPPLKHCPECDSPLEKLVSRTNFELKGRGWYADGYSSKKED
jgi:putative FmdB family regulatory protein